jgi:sugar-specific transcriptional regulator TrmB
MHTNFLQKLGFSDKMSTVYVGLLRLGPSSVREVAENTGINRGTVHEILKELRDKNLVGFYEKDSKQYFVAEDPARLNVLLAKQMEDLQEVKKDIDQLVPELKSLHDKGGERPVARYFEKEKIHEILEDVLEVCERTGDMEYRIYSTAGIREYIYDGFETFSDARLAKGIAVKVIAIGKGGELRGLDERKWLEASSDTQTYIIIYPGKTAYISLDAKNEPVGVVIENSGVYETQKNIFDSLWIKI